MGGVAEVDEDLVVTTETSKIVGSGTRERLGQTQDVKGGTQTAEGDGLSVLDGKKLVQVQTGVVTKSDTTRTLDGGQLRPLHVVKTDGTVVGDVKGEVVEGNQTRVTTGLGKADLTVVLPRLGGLKADLGEELGVRGTGPDLTVVLEVLDSDVELANVIGVSGVERDLTVVVEGGSGLVVVDRLVVVGGNVEFTSVVENTVVGDLPDVEKGQESALVDVKVLEVSGGEITIDGVLSDVKTVSGRQ